MSELFKETIKKEDREKLLNIGFDPDEKHRNASFTLLNDREIKTKKRTKGVELISIGEAIKKYPGIMDKYLWNLVKTDKDDYTKQTYETEPAGYFIRVNKGHKAILPLQACFFIKTEKFKQKVHNLIIMEEDSSLNIINGCASAHYVNSGLHIGVTEIYLQKNSFLSYTMIHDWSDEVEVRPRTGIYVDDSATFISNYISIKKSKITQTFPSCFLKGKDSRGSFNSLIYAPHQSTYDVGARIVLEGKGAKAEVISRTISGGGKVIARGELIGKRKDIKAHLECSGMLLNDKGHIKAIPILEAHHPDVDMSHEASVGKIDEEEIYYLMSRGITEEEAISLIVRGFLDTKILGLPSALEKEVENTINLLENAL